MSERYLLDTGVLTAFMRGRPAVTALVTPWADSGQAFTSALVHGEIAEYLLGRDDAAMRMMELRELLRLVRPGRVSYAVTTQYARLRRAMRAPHGAGLIGDIDTVIAATALCHDAIVVTLVGDFARVPSLRVRLLDRKVFLQR